MRVFKYRLFEKWAKKQGLNDADIKAAIAEIEKGLIDANLGGQVYKKRISRKGEGKSGAYRTIILMKVKDKAIFAHGFSKGEKSNISAHELDGFKVMAKAFLNLSDENIQILLDDNKLIEVV